MKKIFPTMLKIVVFTTAIWVFVYFLDGKMGNLPLQTSQSLFSYYPDPEIASLAEKASMTDKAKSIFYAANPVIDSDRTTFETHCQTPISSNAVELGCYTSDNHIYILRITQPQLVNEMVVVASHEMLHAVYAISPSSQKTSVNAVLEAEFPDVRNRELTHELRNYRVREPGQRDNELHSIIGTEYSPLSTDLETYYAQYFTNRATIVSYAKHFKGVFSQLEGTLSSLAAQIKQLRQQMRI